MTEKKGYCQPFRLGLIAGAISGGFYLLANAPDAAALSGVTLLVSAAVAVDTLTGKGTEG